MARRLLYCALTLTVLLAAALSPGSAAVLFTENFEGLNIGALDKNLSGGANAAPNGSGNPWFGPAPPNAQVVGVDNNVTPHGGSKMIRGAFIAGADFDQNWYNLAFRLNNQAPFTGGIYLDWWFYDPQGTNVQPAGIPDATDFRDYVALGYYNTAPNNTDYPGAGSLNSGVTQIQRLSLGASAPVGYDFNYYQARIVGATDGLANGWFNLSTGRTVGWHHARIEVGPALPNNTNDVSFFIDDMVTHVLTHNSMLTFGYNVIEINSKFGIETGYFDDFEFGTLPIPAVDSIGEAKTYADGKTVSITKFQVMTLDAGGDTPAAFYMQGEDGAAGIRVEPIASETFVSGKKVKVTGRLSTNANGERELINAKVDESDPGPGTIKNWRINNRDLGGKGYTNADGTPAAGGLPNEGLLATTWGKIVKWDSTDPVTYNLWIEDGSGALYSSSPSVLGIKVTNSGLFLDDSYLGKYYTATGVVVPEMVDGKKVRVLRARDGSDVSPAE